MRSIVVHKDLNGDSIEFSKRGNWEGESTIPMKSKIWHSPLTPTLSSSLS